jgi:hypothetical protein
MRKQQNCQSNSIYNFILFYFIFGGKEIKHFNYPYLIRPPHPPPPPPKKKKKKKSDPQFNIDVYIPIYYTCPSFFYIIFLVRFEILALLPTTITEISPYLILLQHWCHPSFIFPHLINNLLFMLSKEASREGNNRRSFKNTSIPSCNQVFLQKEAPIHH